MKTRQEKSIFLMKNKLDYIEVHFYSPNLSIKRILDPEYQTLQTKYFNSFDDVYNVIFYKR